MNLNIKDRSVLILIAANLFPLFGVFFFDWDAIMIVMFYCIETFIIGLFNIAKMIKSEAEIPKEHLQEDESQISQPNNLGNNPAFKVAMALFFFVHYNFFVIGQTVVIVLLSTQALDIVLNLNNFISYEFIINVLLIIFSHAYSYKKNYLGKEEYKKQAITTLMFAPYKRVYIQQLAVILGFFLIILFHGPIGVLILLIGLKLIFDIRSHNKSHQDKNSSLDKMIDLQKESK